MTVECVSYTRYYPSQHPLNVIYSTAYGVVIISTIVGMKKEGPRSNLPHN